MSGIFFVFGPDGSYFLDTPKTWEDGGMPQKFWNAIGDDKIQTIWSLAISTGNQMFLTYKDSKGGSWRWTSNELRSKSPNLQKWQLGQCKEGVRVVFGGANGSYIAWNTSNGKVARWHEIHDRAVEKLKQDDTPVSWAALGVDKAYVIVWQDGRFNWKLRGEYDQLDAILDDTRKGDIEFIALNPYKPEQFFLVLKGDKAVFCVDERCRGPIEKVLAKHGISSTALTSTRASTTSSLPAQASSTGFLKGIVASVNFGASLYSIASAIAGIAACNVM